MNNHLSYCNIKLFSLIFVMFLITSCGNRNISNFNNSNKITPYYFFKIIDSSRILYLFWEKNGDTITKYQFSTKNRIQTIEICHKWYTGAGEATAINIVEIPDFLADSIAYYWKNFGMLTYSRNLTLIGTKTSIEKLYGYSHPIFYKGKQCFTSGKYINNSRRYQLKNNENFLDTNLIGKNTLWFPSKKIDKILISGYVVGLRYDIAEIGVIFFVQSCTFIKK